MAALAPSYTARVSLLCMLCCAATANAQTDLGALLRVRWAHTDNVTLAPAGSEQSENIAVLTGGFDFTHQSPRLTSRVSYQADSVSYQTEKDADEVFNTLNATSQIAIVPGYFSFDVFAVYDQTLVDATGKASFNKLALTGNRTDVAIVGASPSVTLRAGDFVSGEIRYRAVNIDYDDPELQDNDQRVVLFNLGNRGRRRGGTWDVSYDREQYDYGLPRDVELQTLNVELGIWVGSVVRVFTTQGLESDYDLVLDNLYGTPGAPKQSPGLDDHYWYLGAEWRPSERSNLVVQAGERAFGRARSLRWDYRASVGGIYLSYSETPSTFLRDQLSSAQRAGEFTPIDSLDGPRGNPFYLQKGSSFAFVLERPRTNAGIRVFEDRRFDIRAANQGVLNESERYRGAELSAAWRMNSAASLDLVVQSAKRRSTFNVVDDKISYSTLRFSRRIRNKAQFAIAVAHERGVPVTGVGPNLYNETQIIASFEQGFGASGSGGVSQRYSGYVDTPIGP